MADIEREVAISPWSLAQFLTSSLAENQFSMVLEDRAGELVGYAILQRVLDEGTLMNIAIAHSHQGRGLGSRLLSASLAALRDRGARRCLLEARVSNKAAIALYSRHGFVDDGLRPNYYSSAGRSEHALLMSCDLGARR
jgi:ribosomal-protein-alanine N-acetyltransferase